jgi:hypothetical protein
MDKTVKVIGLAIAAGVLAFAIFQLANYYYVDTAYNRATGGHISEISQQDINDLKQLQKKSQALVDDFDFRE